MALNPVERCMALLGNHWVSFRDQCEPRLLLWQVPGNALRLMECFAEVQKLDLPYASGDVFVLLKVPYTHGLQYARDLKLALRGQFDASINDLHKQGLQTDWQFDPLSTPDTPAAVAAALTALGSHFHRTIGHLVAVLMPPTISSLPAYGEWLIGLMDAGLPERLRILTVETLESPGLSTTGLYRDPRVSLQRPAIDGLAIAQNTFAQEGGSNPAAVYRNLLLGAVALAEKGSADQVKAKARDALAFARKQQWADQEVALRILVAGALLKERRFPEALAAYKAGNEAAHETVKSGHPAGLKLALQCWFGMAGVHLAANALKDAAQCYDEAASIAQRDHNDILSIEALRMSAFCLARAGGPAEAMERLARAVDAGAALSAESRALTTLPIALVDMMRVIDADRVAAMQLAKRELQLALEAVRERSELRGYELAATGATTALDIVEAERTQQAEQACAQAKDQLAQAASGAETAFLRVMERGTDLLGSDWLVENDIALPPAMPAATAP